jgi:hypothetical protein
MKDCNKYKIFKMFINMKVWGGNGIYNGMVKVLMV